MDHEVLDSHCHVWRRWPYLPRVPDESSRGAVPQLLYEMDLNDVSCALLVCAPIDNNEDNLSYAARAGSAYPSRLYLAADLDSMWSSTYHQPGSAARLRELDDCLVLSAVSHYLAEDNDGWLRSEEADRLFEEAESRSLFVSLAVPPGWQADLRNLAKRHPGLPVLCHHLGGIRAGVSTEEAEISEVLRSSAVENILIKASGFHYCDPHGWDYPWLKAQGVFRRILAEYGADRVCWGSDFPASTRYCTYRQSLEAVRTHAEFLAPPDRLKVMGATFRRLLERRTTKSGHPDVGEESCSPLQ